VALAFLEAGNFLPRREAAAVVDVGDGGECVETQSRREWIQLIKVLRELDVFFEEIAALGCHIEGEPEKKLRPELIAVWFDEERIEREPKTRFAE
jgi:hypothetical protein